MELTAQILREWFGQFNALYFGKELPEPRFIVNKARHLLGQFSCKKVRQGLFRGYKTIGYTIKVSEYYDLSAHEYQSTLLHEMIPLASIGCATRKPQYDTLPSGSHSMRMGTRRSAAISTSNL